MTDDRLYSAGDAMSLLDSTFKLIERVRNGDQEALDRLIARHVKPLRRWISGRLPRWARDLADTDDLVQDTLLRTFRKMEDFKPQNVGALQAYLRQAVLNRMRDELRRKGRAPTMIDLDDVQLEAKSSPLEEAIGRRRSSATRRRWRGFVRDEREAIIARVEMDYSYQEMAEALDKPSAEAARKAARRALLRLAEEMNAEDIHLTPPRQPLRRRRGRDSRRQLRRWAELESRSGGIDRALLEQLRVLAAVRAVARSERRIRGGRAAVLGAPARARTRSAAAPSARSIAPGTRGSIARWR